MNPGVEATGVEVRYGEQVALTDASLRVEAGRVCALVGTNGAGKSTLFAALIGTARLAAGSVRIAGRSSSAARADGAVAFVPQSERVDWTFPVSVADVVEMGTMRSRGLLRRRRQADRERAEAALERVGMSAFAGRQIGELSGGQRKRVFVARGIAQDARVLLLDEPFAGVDKGSEGEIVTLLRTLAGEGRTVLVSTHDLLGVPTLADEVALVRGTVLFHGPTQEAMRADRLADALGFTLPEGLGA